MFHVVARALPLVDVNFRIAAVVVTSNIFEPAIALVYVSLVWIPHFCEGG